MKDNAYERIMDSKAGKILAGSLVYGIMFEILLYRNMNGIGIPVLMLTTCLFLIGFFRIFEMRIKQETVFYMAAMVLLGISTVLTTSDFFLIWNWFGSICMFFLVLIHQFYDDRKWSFAQYLKIYLRMWFAPFGNLLSPFRALIRDHHLAAFIFRGHDVCVFYPYFYRKYGWIPLSGRKTFFVLVWICTLFCSIASICQL